VSSLPDPSRYVCDASLFPLVTIEFPNTITPELCEQFEADLRVCCLRGRFAVVSDTLHVNRLPSAPERRLLAGALARLSVALSIHCAHNSVVIASPLVRRVFFGVGWLVHLDFPTTLHPTRAEALAAATTALFLQEQGGANDGEDFSGPARR